MIKRIPVTAIIPTANRSGVLQRTIESISKQSMQPEELVIVDASDNDVTERVCNMLFEGLATTITYQKAKQKGAAAQRNQGLEGNTKPVIFFLDDDIVLEPGCIEQLWNGFQHDAKAGGINAMITNQRYHAPGKLSRFMYRLMSGKKMLSYAGKCIGPAWNLLPEDREDLPVYNEVEWLNTTCTIYRKEALPVPAFPIQFKDYSLLEDLSLSLTVGKKWKLFNARHARIFHDSQPGSHKRSVRKLAKMELLNRRYVMIHVMGRHNFSDHCKLFLFELFGIITVLTNITGWKNLFPLVFGKFEAVGTILFTKKAHE